MTANAAFPFLDWPGPIPFAHRGGASEAPENTMPAFEHAVRLGYRYVETDVHVTADGELLAFHDDRLDRVTDATGVIAELPWSTVQRGAGRRSGADPAVRGPPRRVARPAHQRRPEARRRRRAAGRSAAAHRRRRSRVRGRLLRQAPGPAAARWSAARCARRWARARSPASWRRRSGCPAADRPHARRARRCPPHQGRLPLVTDALRGHRPPPRHPGARVDDRRSRPRWTRLLDLGVDGIMTDRPQVLKDLLVERGEWHE